LARVKNPLLALGASGGFAKTVVFAQSQGVPTARQLTPAANPKTVAQVAARQSVANGVQAWHAFIAAATREDLQAWRQLAGHPKGWSGYNGFTSKQLKALAAGHAPVGHLTHYQVTNSHADQVGFDITCNQGAGFSVEAHIGSTPGYQAFNAAEVTDIDGVAHFTNIALQAAPGETVFVFCQVQALFIRSGLYRVKMSF
jgi:hypothetical protein